MLSIGIVVSTGHTHILVLLLKEYDDCKIKNEEDLIAMFDSGGSVYFSASPNHMLC